MHTAKMMIAWTLCSFAVVAADVASFPADEFPACADALAHGSVAVVEDPTSLDYCPPGDDTGGGGTFPPHGCICDWDGAVGTWRLHSHSVIDNDLAVNGSITITDADPSIILDTVTATDTDFWIGVQEDAGADDDDVFQIGKGTTPGTTPFLTIDSSGNAGFGSASPDGNLHAEDSGTVVAVVMFNSGSSTGDHWALNAVEAGADHFLINKIGSGKQEFRLDTGGDLQITGGFTADIGTGVGNVVVDGSSGGCIAIRDTDDAGWTCCDALNGTLSCFTCTTPSTCT